MKQIEHIAVFAAHPDDEGSAWATLYKYYEKGYKISIVWMTYGDKFVAPIGKNFVHYLPLLIKAMYSKKTRVALSRRIKIIRKAESLKAAKLINASPYFLGFNDTKVPELTDLEAIQKITNFIREIKPSIILTHFFREGHKDHKKTSALVSKATLLSSNPDFKTHYHPHKVRIFGFWNERGRGFNPNFFLNVTNQIDRIKDWGNCYESQGFRIVGRFAKLIARINSRKTPYTHVETYRIFGKKHFKAFGEFFP